MQDDASLLRRYAEERDHEAFSELVRRHLDGVYSAALRRVGGDTHRAQDVTQQVFAALAHKAGSLVLHPALSAWLYTATRHEAGNIVRAENRRRLREQEAIAMHELAGQPAPELDWSCVAPLLDEAIDRLSETDRRAVLLRFVDRRGFAEIGSSLGLTEDAARMRVDRALDKLRVMFTKRSIVSSSSALGGALANHAAMAAPVGLAAGVSTSVLASAGSMVPPATWLGTTVQLMSTTKTVVTIAVIAVVLAVLTAIYQGNRAHRAEAALAESASAERIRSLEARLNSTEKIGIPGFLVAEKLQGMTRGVC